MPVSTHATTMTTAPTAIPTLSPGVMRRASRGLSNATSKMNPKYATIVSSLSTTAMRMRRAASARRSAERSVTSILRKPIDPPLRDRDERRGRDRADAFEHRRVALFLREAVFVTLVELLRDD